VRTADFHYDLPAEQIAQRPAPARDHSRLMALDRSSGRVAHHRFPEIVKFFRRGDVLVLNDSKVIPARLRARKGEGGTRFELLLLEENGVNDWWAMVKPGKRAPLGAELGLIDASQKPSGIAAKVSAINAEGHRRLHFTGTENILRELELLGEIPLPPYIVRQSPNRLAEDYERYQTVYAQHAGSVAAPTAGLHFTHELLEQVRSAGVQVCSVTLHVGLGTFAPVKAETLSEHPMHEERFDITPETVRMIESARQSGGRVIAVGTTTMRVLESAVNRESGRLIAGAGRTRIFIYPPFEFRIVDALVTNFHLPCSTLLMLVSAFASPGEAGGREVILSAYAEAIREGYRFFSYGDAMMIFGFPPSGRAARGRPRGG
jgi:S-adenosylmethionine:tRNA ribosyltransferase-isomerase